jgi:hypothetical protein
VVKLLNRETRVLKEQEMHQVQLSERLLLFNNREEEEEPSRPEKSG